MACKNAIFCSASAWPVAADMLRVRAPHVGLRYCRCAPAPVNSRQQYFSLLKTLISALSFVSHFYFFGFVFFAYVILSYIDLSNLLTFSDFRNVHSPVISRPKSSGSRDRLRKRRRESSHVPIWINYRKILG